MLMRNYLIKLKNFYLSEEFKNYQSNQIKIIYLANVLQYTK